jgi:hypothetical protein
MVETVSGAIKFKGTVTYFATALNKSCLNEIGWKYSNWSENTSMCVENYNPAYFVSGQKYDVSDISKITIKKFEYYSNHYSYNTVVTFGLVETQDSTEFVAKEEFSFGKNSVGQINWTVDTSNITGEYYIKCQIVIKDGDTESMYSRVRDLGAGTMIYGTP